MNKKVSFSRKNIFDGKTPKIIYRIANAIWGACAAVGVGFIFVGDYRPFGYFLLIAGFVSKFISEFFSNKEEKSS